MTGTLAKESDALARASARTMPQVDAEGLTLGIAPVVFSAETFHIGRLDPEKHGSLRELRREHGKTHAFRYDARDDKIANVAVHEGGEPMGDVSEAAVSDHLLLIAEAIEHQLRHWFSRSRTILRRYRPLVCLGGRDRLLATALQELGIDNPDPRLDVVAKWSFDLRLIASVSPDEAPWLGLIADVGTSNLIDIPVAELMERGLDPVGAYVGVIGDAEDPLSASRLRLLGRVTDTQGSILILDDMREDAASNRVAAGDVFLEPRREILEATVRCTYPDIAGQALEKLRRIRAPYLNGDKKLEKIRRTIDQMNRSLDGTGPKALNLSLGDGLSATSGHCSIRQTTASQP